MSLFQTARVITLGNANALLNAVRDMNKPAIAEQYARDLEEAADNLHAQLTDARRTQTNQAKNISTHELTATKMAGNIQTLLAGNDDQKNSAKRLALSLVTLRKTIDGEKAALEASKTKVSNLEDGCARMDAKVETVKVQVASIRSSVATTKAERNATAAVKAVSDAASGAGAIDSMVDKVERDAAVSSDAFTRAMASMDGPSSAEHDAEADALIAELSAKPKSSAAA